jgi:hypothetical protein
MYGDSFLDQRISLVIFCAGRRDAPMRTCEGAFGRKHLDALMRVPGVQISALIGGDSDDTSVIPREETPVHIWWRSSRGIGPIRLGHSDHTDQIAFPHPQK